MKPHLSWLLVAGILMAAGDLAVAADLCLDTPVSYPAGSSPRPVLAADLDGDLDPDLVVGNWNDSDISIRLNNGTGSFGNAVDHAVGTNPIAVSAGDLDGDGDLDLIIANWGSNSLSILYNNGNATFAPAVTLGAGVKTSWVIAADLNDDDSLDLAVTNWSDNNVLVMMYQGAGVFASGVPYGVGTGPWCIQAVDIDADGDFDLATANGGTNNLSILENNGDGTFLAGVSYGVGLVPTSVLARDLDGDNDIDLAAANYDSHNVSVLKNNGDGTYASKVDYAVGTIPRSVVACDLDLDGDLDLATANYGSNSMSVLLNGGVASFASPVNFATGSFPISVFTTDFDADGDSDLAVVNTGGNSVSLFNNCVHVPTTLRVPLEYPTIQAGIDAAAGGDTVLVAPGVYAEHIDFSGKGIVVKSDMGASVTTLTKLVDGIPIVRFVNGETNSSELNGFTISGAGVNDGWAIRCQPGSPAIRGNIIFDAPGGPGPAVWCESPDSVILDSNIFQCAQRSDGGLVVYNATAPVISRNLFVGWDTPLIISQSTLVDCSHNTIVQNHYGVLWYYSSGTLRNSICTDGTWYGVRKEGTGTLLLSHNDVYANTPADYYGIVADPMSISLDPFFCDTATADYRLSSGSPCLGAGEDGSDIGAFGQGCAMPVPGAPVVERIGISLPGDSLHVLDPTPELTWKYFDQQSRPHTKSEIEVGTNNDWSVAEMWQPPTIVGPDTSIEYAGLPLTDGATYYVRIRVFNDTLWSNWLVAPFRMNSVPTAPNPVSPSDLSIVLTGRPTLAVSNATDAEGDTRRYDFEVYRDVGLTQLAAYIAGRVEGAGQTSWKTDSLTFENNMHWWRARANDGYENGPWSQVYAFTVDAYNETPSTVALASLEDGDMTSDLTPAFVWQQPTDPDPNPSATYKLILALDPGFVFKSEVSGLTDTTYQWPTNLVLNQSYWWKVEANDGRGGISSSPVWSFTTVTPCACDCHADPVCDGVKSDVVDVVTVIGIAFRGASPIIDPNVACPRLPTDMNCSGATDVVDIVKTVNVAFRGADAATEYCDPCP